MKVSVIYLHVSKSGYPEAPPPDHYIPFEKSFIETYSKFDAGYKHDLVVVSCGLPVTDDIRNMYSGITDKFDEYLGAGSDIGAEQDAMRRLDADFVVSLATPINFWRSGWLKRLVDAREKHGDGLFGPFASNEYYPHIRTSCWGVDRRTFLSYPNLIDTRAKCYAAEHKDRSLSFWQITFWYCYMAKPTLMVTWDGEYQPIDWRKPTNIMYRGDQTNCLMHDRYTRWYASATASERSEADARISIQ